jgi:hypothetical protein
MPDIETHPPKQPGPFGASQKTQAQPKRPLWDRIVDRVLAGYARVASKITGRDV